MNFYNFTFEGYPCPKFGSHLCTDDGWLVWLRRVDNSVSFNRTWDEYERGFGYPDNGNFWFGLENLHNMTNTGDGWMLRAELESWDGAWVWAEYKTFRVSDKYDAYKLTVGRYNDDSTAPDKMAYNNDKKFSTWDFDHDESKTNCAGISHTAGGGWWYNACSYVFATCLIGNEGDTSVPYIFWASAFPGEWNQALKSLSMMLKPEN